ncbi:unnamed protein product [Closterium sp. Naga37s-1]|nr:unnamed protein product [Closterium sp. Naga37s-1]
MSEHPFSLLFSFLLLPLPSSSPTLHSSSLALSLSSPASLPLLPPSLPLLPPSPPLPPPSLPLLSPSPPLPPPPLLFLRPPHFFHCNVAFLCACLIFRSFSPLSPTPPTVGGRQMAQGGRQASLPNPRVPSAPVPPSYSTPFRPPQVPQFVADRWHMAGPKPGGEAAAGGGAAGGGAAQGAAATPPPLGGGAGAGGVGVVGRVRMAFGPRARSQGGQAATQVIMRSGYSVPSLCLTSLSCVAHNCTSPFPICMRCPAFAMHMLSICQPRQLPAVALSFVDRHWSGSSPGTVRGMAWVMGELVTACAAGGAEAGRGAGQQTAAAAAAGVEEGGKAVREALLRAGAVWAKQWSAVPAEHGNGAAELYRAALRCGHASCKPWRAFNQAGRGGVCETAYCTSCGVDAMEVYSLSGTFQWQIDGFSELTEAVTKRVDYLLTVVNQFDRTKSVRRGTPPNAIPAARL